MNDLIQQLRDRAYSGKSVDTLCEQAAAEIERLRSLVRFQDGVIRSGDTATLTTAEREAVADAADRYAEMTPESAATADTLRGLLERLGGSNG